MVLKGIGSKQGMLLWLTCWSCERLILADADKKNDALHVAGSLWEIYFPPPQKKCTVWFWFGCREHAICLDRELFSLWGHKRNGHCVKGLQWSMLACCSMLQKQHVAAVLSVYVCLPGRESEGRRCRCRWTEWAKEEDSVDKGRRAGCGEGEQNEGMHDRKQTKTLG